MQQITLVKVFRWLILILKYSNEMLNLRWNQCEKTPLMIYTFFEDNRLISGNILCCKLMTVCRLKSLEIHKCDSHHLYTTTEVLSLAIGAGRHHETNFRWLGAVHHPRFFSHEKSPPNNNFAPEVIASPHKLSCCLADRQTNTDTQTKLAPQALEPSCHNNSVQKKI